MKQKLLGGALVLASTILSACGAGYGGGYYVRSGPPAPRYYGAVGRSPGVGFVWTDGYWDWRGNNWYWVDGRWMRPPHGHTVWVAPQWRRDGHGYRMRRGYWR